MPTITPDSSLELSEEIAVFFEFLLTQTQTATPPMSIPQILETVVRPGMSASVLAAGIIARFDEAGIPNGPLGSGSPNSMEQLINVICQEIVAHLQSYCRVDVAVNEGIGLTGTGGNSGGPVQIVGQTITPQNGQATLN